MTGGGARGAYQVGVVRALYEIIQEKNKLFEIVTGNSAGSINAVYLAAHAENWDIATENLMELWKRIKPQNIYDLRGTTISDLGLKWLGGTVFGGLTEKGGHMNYLLDTQPLGQPALGWQAFARLMEGLPMPVFALGGLAATDMEDARDAGAHGIAAIRGLWGQV